jgi:hypothetical protein
MRQLAVVLIRFGGFTIIFAALGGAARFMYRGIVQTAGVATGSEQWAWFLQIPVIILVAVIGVLFVGGGIALNRLASSSKPSDGQGSIRG